jgi:hypothetical protein
MAVLARLQHPARLIVAALAAALALVGLSAALDGWQLPGWALPGAAAAAVAYLAVVLALRRFNTVLSARWTSAREAHAWVRWLAHVVDVIAVVSRLVLPLAALPLVLLLFGARGSPEWLQACLGAWTVVVAVLIFHAERPTLAHANKWVRTRRGSRRSATAALAAYAVLPVAALIVAARESHVVDLINQIGGFVTWVALFAIALWLIACLLRLAAFAASPVRLSGFIFLLASAARGAVAVGLVPGEHAAQRIPLPGWFWIALFAATVLAMIVANPVHHSKERPTWRHVATMIETLGFGAAALAAVLFFAAIVLAIDASSTPGRSVGNAVRAPESPGTPTWTQLPARDQRLAEQFAPILELDAAERWPLTSVDDYLKNVELSGNGRHQQQVTADSLPVSCGKLAAPCFTLACRADAPPCDHGNPIGPGAGSRGVEYARVYRLSRRADAAAFIPPRPLEGKRIVAIIEYWLFYRYDRWQASTAFGLLTQQHGADWESVTVGLSAHGPAFVAYSAHCAGTWYPWRSVEARTAALFPGDVQGKALHPLVAVALGSHANYARAAQRRASDWGSCTHVSREATATLTYTWNVRDRTSADFELRPAKVLVVTANHGPTSFAGRWSAADTTTLRNATPHMLASGAGPTSPGLKSLWATPLWTIFRSGDWHRGGG